MTGRQPLLQAYVIAPPNVIRISAAHLEAALSAHSYPSATASKEATSPKAGHVAGAPMDPCGEVTIDVPRVPVAPPPLPSSTPDGAPGTPKYGTVPQFAGSPMRHPVRPMSAHRPTSAHSRGHSDARPASAKVSSQHQPRLGDSGVERPDQSRSGEGAVQRAVPGDDLATQLAEFSTWQHRSATGGDPMLPI